MILILALVIYIYILTRIWRNRSFDWFENLAFSALTLFCVCIFTAMALFASSPWQVETKRVNCEAPIYSLKNVTGIEGQFCLGSGYIGSQEYYYMFRKYPDGGLVRTSLRSRDCVIYQNENSNPHFTWQQIYHRLPYWAVWPNINKLETMADSMYYIYVPSNSVVMKFNVD